MNEAVRRGAGRDVVGGAGYRTVTQAVTPAATRRSIAGRSSSKRCFPGGSADWLFTTPQASMWTRPRELLLYLPCNGSGGTKEQLGQSIRPEHTLPR
jgi:hypothetical protein